MAGLATYDGASSNFENVTAGFSAKTQKHLFTRDNYTFGSVLGELKDELNLTGANFGKTDFSDDYSSGLINAIGYSQATASIDNEYQHNSGEFIKVNGYYQNSGFFIPYFIDDDKTFVTDTFDKVYNYDELVGNNKYFNLNDYVDLSYKYAFGMQKEGNYNHEYSSKNGGQTFYFVKDGNKSETATHTISIEAPMGKIEADDNFDLGHFADEEPDPDMGRIDESDLSFNSDFDNAFTNEELPDEEIGKTPEGDSDFDNGYTNEELPDEEIGNAPEDDSDFDNGYTNEELPDEEIGKTPEDDSDFDNGYMNEELPDEEIGETPEDDSDFDNEFTNEELPDEEIGNAPEDDNDFDNDFTNEELPDEEIGKTPEDDSDFDNEFNVDYEYEEAPSTADSYDYRGPQKKQKTISDIIENKKVVLMQKQRSTSLSFQNNYSVVQDIISKSLLASLSLLEDPNKFLANSNDDSDKEEEIS